ncbi:MAG: DUF1015 family protein [Candidatus Zixiibacteriota bacterium]
MSIVRPFKGVRPKPELAASVACPPYDVLSTSEARAMAQGNPNSFLRVNKSELEFPDGTDPYSSIVYQRAAENLNRLRHDTILVQDPSPCFYVYRLTMNKRSQTGLVALTSVDEYDRGIIKKHEHTRPEKVKDRANHIIQVNAQVGPVFTAFRCNATVGGIFDRIAAQKPQVDFTASDGIRHELWAVADEYTIKEIIASFAGLDYLYIADGHHRSEAASQVARHFREHNPHHTGQEPYNFFLNVLFQDRELHILPYNRVVKDLNGLTPSQLLEKAAASFEITPYTQGELTPRRVHEFGLYAENRWYLLTAKPGTFDATHPTRSIDAAILSENLLAPLLGIINPRTDKRIDFVGGIRGTAELVRLVNSGNYKIAFSLYPTSIEQLFTVADAGEVMPPKSTWFEPKLRDGMVVNMLTD